MLNGIGASQGYGIGSAIKLGDVNLDYSNVEYTNATNEKDRLESAVNKFVKETLKLIKQLKKSAGESEAAILDGHIAMLKDPFMQSQIQDYINQGCVVEKAVDSVCAQYIDMFSAVDDELTRQRVADITDIRDGMLKILLDAEDIDISKIPVNSVVVTKELTPTMVSQFDKNKVCAIVAETGGTTSHSAILTRAMGIPLVLSVENAMQTIAENQEVIVDGFEGVVIPSPNASVRQEYEAKQQLFLEEKEIFKQYVNKPTVTKSGSVRKVYGNIGRVEDVEFVVQNGGEGIGLFRTEFLFMDRNSQPTEDEQFEAYSSVAKAMNGKEVIIRTLDIGGDKEIPYLNIEKEDNPFLGYRAIRYCLDKKPLFKSQIKAILRAGVYGDVKLMLPLVSTVDEVVQAKALIAECESELDELGVEYKSVSVGIMIETPSAALISDLLAKEVDFFSIGTNDLVGYVMAVDRGNSNVSYLYDVTQNAVLRLIKSVITNAKEAGIMVGMCGEGASDTRLIPQLVQWGLDEFSVTPSAILQTRKYICECD